MRILQLTLESVLKLLKKSVIESGDTNRFTPYIKYFILETLEKQTNICLPDTADGIVKRFVKQTYFA